MLTLTEAFNGMMPGYFGISHEFTGTSDHVMIEAGFRTVSVAVHPELGETARIEYTLSCRSDIDGGTARWMVWPAGNVSTSADDALLSHACAIRGVTSGGTARLEVVAT